MLKQSHDLEEQAAVLESKLSPGILDIEIGRATDTEPVALTIHRVWVGEFDSNFDCSEGGLQRTLDPETASGSDDCGQARAARFRSEFRCSIH